MAYALLILVPGLAAGFAGGGGWRRGLLTGLLGAAGVLAFLLAIDLLLVLKLQLGFSALTVRIGRDLMMVSILAAASAMAGAGGGELRARWGPHPAIADSSVDRNRRTHRPRLPRWLIVLQWTAVLLLVLPIVVPKGAQGLLPLQMLPAPGCYSSYRCISWAALVLCGIAVAATALVSQRTIYKTSTQRPSR